MYYDNDVIEHHGVLGMKWGVRHDKKAAAKAEKTKRKAEAKAARKNLSLGTRALATTGKVGATLGGIYAGALAGNFAGSAAALAGLTVASALGAPVTAIYMGTKTLSTGALLAYTAAVAGGTYSGAALGGVKVHDIADDAIDTLLIQKSDRVTKNNK